MSTDWGSATDASGARISLLHGSTTSKPLSSSPSSSQGDHLSGASSRHHSAALPPISPLLNVSYPGTAQTSIKRALNISTSYDGPYYTNQPASGTSGPSAASPTATTPGFSEYHSAPTSQHAYSPKDTDSALDPSLLSASSYARNRPTFSRPSSFSLPRESWSRYPHLTDYGSQGGLGYENSPPRMSERSYQNYICRGDDLRRSESYVSTSASAGSMDSEGPFTPRDEDPAWRNRYRLSQDGCPGSMLGKRSRDEREEYGYQYPPPPPGPEYESRYQEETISYPYRADAREYRPRASTYTYPPPPAPHRGEALSYAPPALVPSCPSTSTSSRYSPIRSQPTRSSSLRTPISRPSDSPASSSSAPKKFPCRFSIHPGIYCQQTFTTSGHASRHAKIHKEEKGISCVYPGCGKRFTRGDNMKQHLETHFRVRGGRGKDKKMGKKEGEDKEDTVDRAEMQRLLREGAERRERERGEHEGRRRAREENMSISVSPRTAKVPNGRLEMMDRPMDVPYFTGSPLDALDALATIAVGRK